MKRLLCIVLLATHAHLFAFRDIRSTFYFDSDIDTLNMVQYQQLLEFVTHTSVAKQYKEVYIAGYTDADGTFSYNIDLSKRRADFVAKLLVQVGLPEILLDKNFKGEEDPVAANTTEKNKSKNRRVEVILRLFDIKTAVDIVKEIHGNEEQVFLLDNTQENFIEGKNGMRFIFPPFCFDMPDNKKSNYKTIKIVLTEVANVQQGFFSNVLAESTQGLLKSGGMYKITAFHNEKELKLKKDQLYTVQINNKDVQDNMSVYAPQSPNKDGLMRWDKTNMKFERTTSFNGKRPSLELDEEEVINWNIQSNSQDVLTHLSVKLPVKPIKPVYPRRPYLPYEPKITAARYQIPWVKKIFMTKTGREKAIHKYYDMDKKIYEVQMKKFNAKLSQFLSDSATFSERTTSYEQAYISYKDSVKWYVNELEKYKLAIYEDAFLQDFELAKRNLVYLLKNKTLFTHELYNDVLMYCNRAFLPKVFNQAALKIYSDAYAKLEDSKPNFPYLSGSRIFVPSVCDNGMIYPYLFSVNFMQLLQQDTVFRKSVMIAESDLMEKEVKLGLFDPGNFKTYYQASLSNFGWMNCDRYMDYKKDDIFTLQIPDYNLKDKNIFAVVKEINSQISIPLGPNGRYVINLPKNKDIVVVAIGLDNNNTPVYATYKLNTVKNTDLNLSFKPAKLSEIKQMILSI